MLDFHRAGVPVIDYGNNIRQIAKEESVADAFDFPGFVPTYIRPLFCRGVGPFRWVRFSQYAGMVIVCDGTAEAEARIRRVLWNDPASGVLRHADAGYDEAIAAAREFDLDLPGVTTEL